MYRQPTFETLYFNPLFHAGISHQPLRYPVLFGGNLAPQEQDTTLDSASCSCQTARRRSQRGPNGTPRATETLRVPGSEHDPSPGQPVSAVNPVDILSNPGLRQSYVSSLQGQPFHEAYYDEMVPLANLRPPSKSFGNCVWLLFDLFCRSLNLQF